MTKMDFGMQRVITIGAILGSVAGILAFIQFFFGLGIITSVFQLIAERPGWFWLRGLLIYASLFLSCIASVLLWYPRVASHFRRLYLEERIKFFRKLAISFVLFIFYTLFLTTIMFHQILPDKEAEKLFPQAADMGSMFIRSYATNGSVRHTFFEEASEFGPKDGYSRITFKLHGSSIEHNGGWVMFLLRGADLSRFSELRFLIRGQHGDEIIGIKAKDARGVEIQLLLGHDYLREGQITANWQEAVVPFEHFGNLDFSFMDNFSLYTTGDMIGTRPQTIYVGDFRLR